MDFNNNLIKELNYIKPDYSDLEKILFYKTTLKIINSNPEKKGLYEIDFTIKLLNSTISLISQVLKWNPSTNLERSRAKYIKNGSGKSEKYNGFYTIGINGCSYKLINESETTDELFLEYFEEVLESGFLKEESTIVIREMFEELDTLVKVKELCKKYNVIFLFLPQLSIKRNPIQRFFDFIKKNFYNNKQSKSFLDEIIDTIENCLKINEKLFAEFYCETLAFWPNQD
ncbi:hypothetical protein ACTFIU_010465 [Dictyostelium citrinum]